MPDFITLSCPSCGGKLEITSDIERFACAHCGMEHLVKRTSSLVSLSPVVAEIKKVTESIGRTASELAIVRLEKEIATLNNRIKTLREKHQLASSTAEIKFNYGEWGLFGLLYGIGFLVFSLAGIKLLTIGIGAAGVPLVLIGFGLVVLSNVHYEKFKKASLDKKVRRMQADLDMELNGLIAQVQLKQNELAIHRGDVGLS